MGKVKDALAQQIDADVVDIRARYANKEFSRDGAIDLLLKHFFGEDAKTIVNEWDYELAKEQEEAGTREALEAAGAAESEDV